MNDNSAVSPNLSLSALRGAVGGVFEMADDLGRWDRLVGIWRIFLALDGLIGVLWAIVHRLRGGGGLFVGSFSARAARAERLVVAGSGPVRLRAVAGVRTMAGRRVLTEAVASVGRVRRSSRARVDWGPGVAGVSPVLAIRRRRFSELGWSSSWSCVLIVTI
jgi:hypothetical protein